MIRLRSLVQRLDLGHRDGDALRAGRGAEVATAGSADDRPGHVPPHGRGDEIRAIGFARSEEHTSELQSLMRISYAVFCLKKNTNIQKTHTQDNTARPLISQTTNKHKS